MSDERIPCPRCGGVGSVSTKSLSILEERVMRATAESRQKRLDALGITEDDLARDPDDLSTMRGTDR